MPTYCFRCKSCGHSWQSIGRDQGLCPSCRGRDWVRDYRAESVGIHPNATPTRRAARAQAEDILPMASDFAGPGDPDGVKGLRQWRDEHHGKSSKAAHPQERLLRKSY